MATTVPTLKKYIDAGYNIMLQGKHGVGKTEMLREACKQLGLNLKYFSAATLDPYTDLVGVPYPEDDGTGGKTLVSIRPRSIDQAEVIFMDELNRADPKVLNAVLELVQFHTINGELLPNLKCVIAAQNPPDSEYTVDPLDPALVDRFQITLDVDENYSVSYLSQVGIDRATAKVVVAWVKEHGKKAGYVSPRRVEYICRAWDDLGTKTVLADSMPPGNFDVNKLYTLLTSYSGSGDVNMAAAPDSLEELIEKYDVTGIRHNLDHTRVAKEWRGLSKEAKAKVLQVVSFGSNGEKVAKGWTDLLKVVDESETDVIMNNWPKTKIKLCADNFRNESTTFGRIAKERSV